MASHHIDFSRFSRIRFGSLEFLCFPDGDMVRLLPPSDGDVDSVTELMGNLCLHDGDAPIPAALRSPP